MATFTWGFDFPKNMKFFGSLDFSRLAGFVLFPKWSTCLDEYFI